MSFLDRLRAQEERFGPICVGADPHGSILVDWGLSDSVSGLAEFNRIFTEAFAGRVGSIKPQVAFYERFGSAGLAELEKLIASFRDAGTLVIADAKRGDIGSTMTGYGLAWLGDGPLGSDAVTLSPYLGVGALAPAFEMLGEDRGAFVLALTSNPEGASVQGGSPAVAQTILKELGEWNKELGGAIGAVIGATAQERITTWGIDVSVLGGAILAPGVGAQGASLADARALAGSLDLVVPISRGILRHGPDPERLFAAYEKESK